MYALNLLKIALELAQVNPVYEDIASKFFEHFMSIAGAMNYFGGGRKSLWDYGDGFYYDQIHFSDGRYRSIKLRSMVGLIPLFAVETVDRTCSTRARLRPAREVVPRKPAGEGGQPHAQPGRSARHVLDCLAESSSGACSKMLDPEEFFSRPRDPLALEVPREESVRHRHRGPRVPGGLQPGRIADLGSSAATRTGAGRSGCR